MPRPGRPAYASPRAVRVLLGSAAVTYVGDEVAAVALALSLHASGASGFAVAALFAAKMVPVVLLAPLAGSLVDRVGPARALQGASAAMALVVGLTALTSSVPLWLTGTALLGVASAVAHPALLALLPVAAGADASRRALSWAAVASRSSAATGALLAGVLMTLGGLRLALLVDAVTCLLVVVGVQVAAARVSTPSAPGAEAPRRSPMAGFRVLGGDPVLRVVVGVLLAAVVPMGISYVAVFFFIADPLGGGATATTAVVAAYGAGMTLGCWLAGRLATPSLARVAVRAPLLVGAGFLAPVLLPAVPVAVVGFALAGLAAGTAFTAMRGIVVERVPGHLLGRVYAAESALGTSAELLSLALAGAAVALAGPAVAMVVCGVGTLLAGVVGVLVLPDVPVGAAPVVPFVPAPRAASEDRPPAAAAAAAQERAHRLSPP